MYQRCQALSDKFKTKKAVIEEFSGEFGRGRFLLDKVLKEGPGPGESVA